MPDHKYSFRTVLCFLCVVILAASVPGLGQNNPSAIKIALVGGSLIDGSGAAPLENAVLLIENGLIADIGVLGDLPVPEDYTVISTEGRTMLPGLWDMHVHLLYAGHTNYPYWHQNYTEQFAENIMPATALQLLQAGVTSARDLGAPPESVFRVRDQIAANELPGPTLYVAGPQLTPEPPEWAQFYRRNIAGSANAQEQANALVERQADVLKISNAEGLRLEDVRSVVDIAHAQNLKVTAHGRSDAEIEIGLQGGVDEFQHIGLNSERYPDSVMRLIEERIDNGEELFWTPTIGLQLRAGTAAENRELLDDPENFLGLADNTVRDILTSMGNYDPDPVQAGIVVSKISQLREAGVRLLVGTDAGLSGNPHSQAIWQEMLSWVEMLGIAPLETIHAATALPAQVMGVDNLVGTLEVGKYADIVVVHGDPLASMRVLSDPELVIKHGQIMFDRRP